MEDKTYAEPTLSSRGKLFGRPIAAIRSEADPCTVVEVKGLTKKRKEASPAEPEEQDQPAAAPLEEIVEQPPPAKKAKLYDEEELTAKLEEPNRRASEAESRLAEKQAVLERLQAELDSSRRDCAANLAQLDEVRAQLVASVKKRDELQLQITKGIAHVQQQDERIAALETNTDHLKQQHASDLNEIATLRTRLIGAESQITTFQDERNTALETEKRLVKENAQLRQELADRAVDLELAQKSLNEQSHSAINSLLNSPSIISDEAIQKRLQAYATQIAQLAQKLDDSDKSERKQRSKAMKFERERDELAADLRSAQRNLDKMEQSNRDLRDELDRIRRESSSNQTNSIAFQKLEMQKTELEMQLKAEKERRIEKEHALRRAQDDLEQAKKDLSKERREHSDLLAERNRLVRMLDEERRAKPAPQQQPSFVDAFLSTQLLTMMQGSHQQQLPALTGPLAHAVALPLPAAHPHPPHTQTIPPMNLNQRRRAPASVEPLPDDYNMPYHAPHASSGARSQQQQGGPPNPYH